MKIKYKFVDGTVAEIEVDESIGTVITELRCLEGNLAHKESYHCYTIHGGQEANRLVGLSTKNRYWICFEKVISVSNGTDY